MKKEQQAQIIKTVLVVEDNYICQEAIKIQLAYQNYHVDIAHDVERAISKLHKHSYHFIFTDLHLPDNLGGEVIKFTRASERHQDTPLLLGSAQLSKEDFQKYLDLGADAVLSKPYPMNNLCQIMDECFLLPIDQIRIYFSKKIAEIYNKK